MIWRRPSSSNGVAGRAADATRPAVEPVRAGDPVVNLNRPTPGVAPYVPPSPATPVQSAVWRTQRVIYYVLGVIEAILAIRFVLKLIAANPNNAFTQGVYAVSWVFDFPFNGVVSNVNLGNGSVIEFFSIVAIIVYLLGGWALAKLVGLLI